jgi:uncharacterized metal-binding protein YceD (DUF177 family)
VTSADTPPPPPPNTALTFNVATLLSEPIGARREYALDGLPFTFQHTSTPLHGTIHLLRTDSSLMAVLNLQLTISETCGACLEPYDTAITLDFEEEFWPDYDPLTNQRPDVPPEREGFPIVEAQLDLHEAVRQYVEMERPMSPRCSVACPGPTRSTDTPRDPTAASSDEPIDSRWAALQTLRDRWR